MTIYYLRKRSADQPFWAYVPHDARLHPALAELVTRDETPIGMAAARDVFAELHGLGFRDDEPTVGRTPVELVSLDGEPVPIAA